MSYTTTHHGSLATAVECHKQVRSWRLLRAVVELLLPTCNCTASIEPQDQPKPTNLFSSTTNSSIFTGTIFGFRSGKFNFCIQTPSRTPDLNLLLELIVPTSVLAREMQGGVLRIALESYADHTDHFSSLFWTPLWNMYCNGRRVGYAVKREPSKTDIEALNVLSSVNVGAGVVNGNEMMNLDDQDHMMYLRANFRRVFGSSDSESFHLIDPDGNIGQELSIFFFRSPP